MSLILHVHCVYGETLEKVIIVETFDSDRSDSRVYSHRFDLKRLHRWRWHCFHSMLLRHHYYPCCPQFRCEDSVDLFKIRRESFQSMQNLFHFSLNQLTEISRRWLFECTVRPTEVSVGFRRLQQRHIMRLIAVKN